MKALIILAAATAPIGTADLPAWNLSPTWICQTETVTACEDLKACETMPAAANWTVDFAKMTMSNFSANASEPIMFKRFSDKIGNFPRHTYFSNGGGQIFSIGSTPKVGGFVEGSVYPFRVATLMDNEVLSYIGVCKPS